MSTEPINTARWLFLTTFSVQFQHFACKLQKFRNIMRNIIYNIFLTTFTVQFQYFACKLQKFRNIICICISTFEVSMFLFFYFRVKVCFREFFIEEIDCSLSCDRPPSVVYTGSVKMWRYLSVSKLPSDKNTAPPREYKKTKTRKFLPK